jgi:hypothetical protein
LIPATADTGIRAVQFSWKSTSLPTKGIHSEGHLVPSPIRPAWPQQKAWVTRPRHQPPKRNRLQVSTSGLRRAASSDRGIIAPRVAAPGSWRIAPKRRRSACACACWEVQYGQ